MDEAVSVPNTLNTEDPSYYNSFPAMTDMYSAESTQVPEKTLISVQRPITQVWKQLLGQVWAVISFHLSPRSLGLCKSISEKIASEVGYPNAKTVKQYTKTL